MTDKKEDESVVVPTDKKEDKLPLALPLEKKVKKVDHLNEDEVIKTQQFVCISFLSPEGIKNCSVRGLKIRGVYATKEEADKRADELQKIDPDFDVFVGEVGKWLPWDPEPNSVEDQVYQEKELNDLMKGYKDNLDKAKKMQQQRKTDMIKSAAVDEQSKSGPSIKERLQKKLEEKKKDKKFNDLAKKQLKMLDDDKKVSDKKPKEKKVTIDKSSGPATPQKSDKKTKPPQDDGKMPEKKPNETIDEKLTRIQKLYEKLNQKKADA